jgi:hypothetical protein
MPLAALETPYAAWHRAFPAQQIAFPALDLPFPTLEIPIQRGKCHLLLWKHHMPRGILTSLGF